nr:PREDICTED: uncharacterized protein LOC109040608 [Bemisia tabaci]
MSSSDEETQRRPKRYKTYLDPTSDNFGVPSRRTLLRMEKAATNPLPGPLNVRSPSRVSPGHSASGHDSDHERLQPSSPSDPDNPSSSDDQVSDSSDSEMNASDLSDGEGNLEHLLIEDEEILEVNPPPQAPPIDEEVLKHNAYSKKYGLDNVVIPTARLTRFEILTLIQHFNLRFGLSNRGVVGLIELVNTLLGTEVIPPSHYIFQEIFLSQTERTFHFYCPKCSLYVSANDPPENLECTDCHAVINPKTTGPSTNYFVSLSLESQLRKHLEENGPKYINFIRNRPQNADVISDVMDGLLYQDLHQAKSMSDVDFTLTFNTDGANIAESNSKNSVWPIQVRLNEIDPVERFSVNNVILAGVVYGKTPKMTAYLTPFITELKKLAHQGVTWFNSETNEFVTSKIYLLLTSLDTPAKAKVLRMVQFNGKDGCYLCKHPGNLVNRNQVRYGTADHCEEKTNESVRADMMAALQTGAHVNGQKGASPLIALKYFSFPFAVVIDIMHSHFLGVSKTLISKIWMNSQKYKHQDFYLTPEKIQELDARIMKMTPPSEISREPRSITQHSDWKASEWRNWLFYYGPVVLRGIIPDRYVKHFCLLSCSLYILYQAEISRYDLPIVHEYLQEFVRLYEVYYGLVNMTSNVHSTTHLKSCVIWGGPLWAHTTFQF